MTLPWTDEHASGTPGPEKLVSRTGTLAKAAWGVLGANVLVILWGAYVRATGSGAGCGRHWPLCNGEVLPRAKDVAMRIEFTHRATSGIAMLSVFLLTYFVFRAHRHQSRTFETEKARSWALLSSVLMVTEALLGAGLVLFRLVANDTSLLRGVSTGAHLVNTFFLLYALTSTAFWLSTRPRTQGPPSWPLRGVTGAFVLVGVTGAIAALGDTLFPARSLAEGFWADLSPAAHAFLRLRTFHPLLAALTGVLLVMVATSLRAKTRRRDVLLVSRLVTLAFVAQLALGLLNLALLAPVSMQLAHLLLADVTWCLLAALGCVARSPLRTSGA